MFPPVNLPSNLASLTSCKIYFTFKLQFSCSTHVFSSLPSKLPGIFDLLQTLVKCPHLFMRRETQASKQECVSMSPFSRGGKKPDFASMGVNPCAACFTLFPTQFGSQAPRGGEGHCDHCLLFRDLSDTISREVQDMRGTKRGFQKRRWGSRADMSPRWGQDNVMWKKKEDNDKEAD